MKVSTTTPAERAVARLRDEVIPHLILHLKKKQKAKIEDKLYYAAASEAIEYLRKEQEESKQIVRTDYLHLDMSERDLVIRGLQTFFDRTFPKAKAEFQCLPLRFRLSRGRLDAWLDLCDEIREMSIQELEALQEN